MDLLYTLVGNIGALFLTEVPKKGSALRTSTSVPLSWHVSSCRGGEESVVILLVHVAYAVKVSTNLSFRGLGISRT